MQPLVPRLKAAKKLRAAQAKTQEYLPCLEPVVQEDRTAALESEQTGQQIEVKNPETVEAAQGTEVTAEMLANLGVSGSAIRNAFGKGTIGKDLTDPDVQKKLRNYAKNSLVRTKVPELEARVETLLGGINNVGTEPAGLGSSTQDSGPSGVGTEGATQREDTPIVRSPDQGPVGTGVPVSGSPAVDAGPQSDTLAEARSNS